MTRGLLIAAPRSGSGKTTVTLALLAAARAQNLAIRAAKCGPDYIDPAFHAAATGHPSCNFDSWAMSPAQLHAVAATAAQDADFLVAEASMGLFDGVAGPPGRTGAGADIAAALGLPVILVLDVSGQSQSAAAIARGFAAHMPGVNIAGVILNRVASERHRQGVAAAMASTGIKIFGAIPRDEHLHLPERHLGLVQALEHPDLRKFFDKMADLATTHFDLPAIFAAAAPLASPPGPAQTLLPPPGQRIALAQDAAFSFIYAHVLKSWRDSGAEILPFSPLADCAPPADADCCWLPGGYPELHAPQLAQAKVFSTGLKNFAQTRPVHGECGGYMVLGDTLQSADGTTHPMTGLLSHATSFFTRKMHLGYRTAHMLEKTTFGPPGTIIRGHEFHYAQLTTPGTDAPLAQLTDAAANPLGPAGGKRGLVSGGFFHAIAIEKTP